MIADVAIDQGGCFETSRPTTHSDPVYMVDGVTHYCVANMPGAVPVTSTKALTNATLPYVEAIADDGLREAIARDRSLARGVNVLEGKITYEAVAEAHGLEYTPLEDVLPLLLSRRTRPVRASPASRTGETLTTTQVTAAAKAITAAAKRTSPISPRAVSMRGLE